MLHWVYTTFGHDFGPLRLFDSFFFLAAAGFAAAAFSTWVLLPRLWNRLPRDMGRAFAVGAEASVGKPVSAGVIFVSLFCIACLVFLPWDTLVVRVVPFVFVAMLVGFVDDRKRGGLSEYQLAALDAALAIGVAFALLGLAPVMIWLPIWPNAITLSPWLALPLASGVIWLSINATNCSDGVDGVSGSLTGVSIMILGGLMYAVIGDAPTAAHLHIPYNPEGANWAIMAFLMVGCIAGYLWYNANPSLVLMGDAGSRPLGLLIGLLVVATGNPLFLLLAALVIVVNGATGLVKIALKRFFGLPFFPNIRFPLHDHARKELGWSNTQVLVRFMLLHIGVSAVLVVLALKVR
jgi:phospho-N-acetylmuramoyl-pentapeptide-transferase